MAKTGEFEVQNAICRVACVFLVRGFCQKKTPCQIHSTGFAPNVGSTIFPLGKVEMTTQILSRPAWVDKNSFFCWKVGPGWTWFGIFKWTIVLGHAYLLVGQSRFICLQMLQEIHICPCFSKVRAPHVSMSSHLCWLPFLPVSFPPEDGPAASIGWSTFLCLSWLAISGWREYSQHRMGLEYLPKKGIQAEWNIYLQQHLGYIIITLRRNLNMHIS